MRRVISLKSPWRPRSDPLFLSRVRKEEKVKWPYTCGMLCAVSMSVTYAHGSYHPAYRRACVIRQYLPKIYIYIYIQRVYCILCLSCFDMAWSNFVCIKMPLSGSRIDLCVYSRIFISLLLNDIWRAPYRWFRELYFFRMIFHVKFNLSKL